MLQHPGRMLYSALRINGRGERIRTSDPLVPNQVRYQTALRPERDTEWVSVQPASREARWFVVPT